MLEVTLPVVGQSVDVVALVALGVAVGFVSGFFGVGGGVISVPMLHVLFRIDYNFAVGSSLAVIFGTSISATLRHRRMHQVDYKLGGLMVAGVVCGTWLGAGVVELLKRWGTLHFVPRPILAVNFVLPLAYTVCLIFIGVLFYRESVRRKRELRADPSAPFVAPLSRFVRAALSPPRLCLPASGIERVSLWMLLLIGLGGGFVSGLLGVGGGIVQVPAMIYLLGIPTAVAIGTSLFIIIFASGMGTIAHATAGNCDIVLAVCLLVGSTVGAQLGAFVMRKLRGVQIRHAFAFLAYATAALVAFKLLLNLGVL